MAENEELPKDRWSDEALLLAACDGDDDAFGIFCVRVLPRLKRYLSMQCATRGVPRDLARDFAQETISKALAHIQIYREESGWARPKVSAAWLFQIGIHVLADWVRRNRRAKKAHAEKTGRDRDEINKEKQEKLEEVLKYHSWLRPNEKEITELILMEGLHPLEAGERMGLSEAAAYKTYERAMQHLRDFIREHSSMADQWFR